MGEVLLSEEILDIRVRPVYAFEQKEDNPNRISIIDSIDESSLVLFLVEKNSTWVYVWGARTEKGFIEVQPEECLCKKIMLRIQDNISNPRYSSKILLILMGTFRSLRQFETDIMGIPIDFYN